MSDTTLDLLIESDAYQPSLGYLDEDFNVVPCCPQELLKDDRFKRQFQLVHHGETVTISTTFLGVRHWPDAWFETAVIDLKGNLKVRGRYTTVDEARKGHEQIVEGYAV